MVTSTVDASDDPLSPLMTLGWWVGLFGTVSDFLCGIVGTFEVREPSPEPIVYLAGKDGLRGRERFLSYACEILLRKM